MQREENTLRLQVKPADRPRVCDDTRLRQAMERQNLDLIVAHSRANVGYLTGHFTTTWHWDSAILHFMKMEYEGWDYVVYGGFPKDSKKDVFLLEYNHRLESVSRQGTWADKLYGYYQGGRYQPQEKRSICFDPPWQKTATDVLVQAIRESGCDKGRIGIEFNQVSKAVFEELRRQLPWVEWVDIWDLLLRIRAVKTLEEQRRLRDAFKVATEVYQHVIPTIRAGDTPYGIFLRELEEIYARRGTFLAGHICFGTQDISNSPPPDQPLQPGQVGTLDLCISTQDYQTDYGRVVCLGTPPDGFQKTYDTLMQGMELGLRGAQPGRMVTDLFWEVASFLEKHDLCFAMGFMGHGTGLDVHEYPFINPFREGDVLEIGMTPVLEFYFELKDYGVFLVENTGILTADGFENLCTFPYRELMVLTA